MLYHFTMTCPHHTERSDYMLEWRDSGIVVWLRAEGQFLESFYVLERNLGLSISAQQVEPFITVVLFFFLWISTQNKIPRTFMAASLGRMKRIAWRHFLTETKQKKKNKSTFLKVVSPLWQWSWENNIQQELKATVWSRQLPVAWWLQTGKEKLSLSLGRK